jgi:glycosyltransferase involved in cell wall biosynthesis
VSDSKNKIRVLLVIPSLSQGGAERQILQLMRRLDPTRFEIDLCTLYDDQFYAQLALDGQPRYRLSHPGSLTPGALRRLADVMREARPDIVHTFMDQGNLWVRLAAPLARMPIVITSTRGPWMRPGYLAIEWALARYVGRAVVVNARSTYDEMVGLARVPRERVHLIHNFVDFDEFRPGTQEERRKARTRFGLAPDEVTLLLPGRVVLQKHHVGLAIALGRLRRRGALPTGTRLLFAGRERDPWYAKLAWPALRAAGVEPMVRKLGVVPAHEMRDLYLASDVLILPSLWEGLPNALLEAHACGRPAVVTDRADTDGIVLDGASGFVAPLEWGMGAYADALGRMLALTDAERLDMGRRGAEHVRRAFAPESVLGDYLRLYDALLVERERAGRGRRRRRAGPE